MSAHQAHRLPWETLGELFRSVSALEGRQRYHLSDKHNKQLLHFARCFTDALKEFAASDNRAPEDEEGNSLDPTTWGIDPLGAGAYTGYYRSLLRGYVELNLLLTDSQRFQPILQLGRERAPWALGEPCGFHDGGHPAWMARRLRPILTPDGRRLEPMSAELLQTIRDHCALMFRCLYSISGENRAFDSEFVAQFIAPSYVLYTL